jgi:hypothetical protein
LCMMAALPSIAGTNNRGADNSMARRQAQGAPRVSRESWRDSPGA